MAALTTQFVRDLRISPDQHPRGETHLSAASGLVMLNQRFYVVADDEQHLATFAADFASQINLVRLFEGDLPDKKGKRKALKADLEVLVLITPDRRWPSFAHGALLALGSGSRLATREKGVLLTLAQDGTITDLKPLDLSAWYSPLHHQFADLNIEGGLILGDTFRLFHRANTKDPRNACIEYHWPAVMRWLVSKTIEPPPVLRINLIELGAVDGVPLGITDAASVNDELWAVSAAAENSNNSYTDGPCLASAIALINCEHQVVAQYQLAGSPKVEGLVAKQAQESVTFTFVTDSDNPAIASQMRTAAVVLPAMDQTSIGGRIYIGKQGAL